MTAAVAVDVNLSAKSMCQVRVSVILSDALDGLMNKYSSDGLQWFRPG